MPRTRSMMMHTKRRETLLEYYFSLEHGSETDKVPSQWRRYNYFAPCSFYGLSSFMYSLAGVWLLALQVIHPDRMLYSFEYSESILWIWQGLISYKCDALDMGVRSWSHPCDRISATLFTVFLLLKYTFVDCVGRYGPHLLVVTTLLFLVGLYCFHRSCRACRAKSPRDYCFWHSTWHFVFPLTMIHFNSAQFLADAEAVSCGFTQPFMPLRQLLASVG